jgi:hypothetical protein
MFIHLKSNDFNFYYFFCWKNDEDFLIQEFWTVENTIDVLFFKSTLNIF